MPSFGERSRRRRPGSDRDALTPILLGAAALPPFPGLASGIAAGELLRRHRFAWTWALLASLAVTPTAFLLPTASEHARIATTAAQAGELEGGDVLAALWL